MFRGTLKLNTLIATLQMVDRICEVALYLSDQEMQGLTWADFVSGCSPAWGVTSTPPPLKSSTWRWLRWDFQAGRHQYPHRQGT